MPVNLTYLGVTDLAFASSAPPKTQVTGALARPETKRKNVIDEDPDKRLRDIIREHGTRFRSQTGVLLTIGFLAALIVSVILRTVGVNALWLRYGISTISGYIIFLVIYLFWYSHVRLEIRSELLENRNKTRLRVISSYETRKSERLKSNPVVDFFIELLINFAIDEFALVVGVVIIVIAIAVILFISPYIVLDLLLGEAVLLIATRGTAEFRAGEALWKIAASTLGIFFALLLAIEVWSIILMVAFPGVESLGDVLGRVFLHS